MPKKQHFSEHLRMIVWEASHPVGPAEAHRCMGPPLSQRRRENPPLPWLMGRGGGASMALQEALGAPDLWGRSPVHLAADADATEVLQAPQTGTRLLRWVRTVRRRGGWVGGERFQVL